MPKLRERIMLCVYTPDEFLGDVMGALHAHRAQVEGMEPVSTGNVYTVLAYVPEADLFNYPLDLGHMTQGRASCEMEFSHYRDSGSDDAPDNGAGVGSPLQPSPPTPLSHRRAQPPPDETIEMQD
jgi:translation elongation factor EF-G